MAIELTAEEALALWTSTFDQTSSVFFETDVADAIEADYFVVDSVDRATYDPALNRLTYEITTAWALIYESDLDEWQDDTWEVIRDFARDLWLPFRESAEPEMEDLVAVDWSTWTPALHIDAEGGDLYAHCPGDFIDRLSRREATQTEFVAECTFRN